jgi:alpha-1,3-glucosyltransferase
MLFLPFLSPFPTALFQSLHRIFPFARGLFEDKVANFWCALNVVIKLRNLASVTTLARMSLLLTGTAVLPSTIGVIWISYRLGRQTRRSSPPSTTTTSTSSTSSKEASSPAPTCHLLPHLLLTSSLCFFLFSFQVHEKSILLPLMPLTLLMGGREKGYGRLDWEWGVLLNNVAVFS